jgi:hypothetical protein
VVAVIGRLRVWICPKDDRVIGKPTRADENSAEAGDLTLPVLLQPIARRGFAHLQRASQLGPATVDETANAWDDLSVPGFGTVSSG